MVTSGIWIVTKMSVAVGTPARILRDLEESTDPDNGDLACLKSIILRRIADIEIAGATVELEPRREKALVRFP